jgi:hypothetical protein
MPNKKTRFSRLMREVRCAVCGAAATLVEVPAPTSASGSGSSKDVKAPCYCSQCGHMLPDTVAEEKQPKEG